MQIPKPVRPYLIKMFFCLMLAGSFASFGQQPPMGDISDNVTKPWAYWWWMGSSVTKDGISQNLKAYKDAGLGGMHIIPIYGEKGDEENFIEYLSPQWMEMLVHTVNEAEKLGMGIDMSSGTGWPFGGPNVSLEHSAKTFELKPIDLHAQIDLNEVAGKPEGAKVIRMLALDKKDQWINITSSIQENGTVQDISDYQKGLLLIVKPTGQKVKRAAPGGKGLVVDHFNQSAIDHYLKRFQMAFDNTEFASGKVRAFYNDSYEAYGANFTKDFLEKFKALRGYDLTDYLGVLADSTHSETRERIITDFSETISDLLLEGFTTSWVEKSNEMGMITRNQAHGSPGNILDLYGAVDVPETESFGVSNFSIPGLKKDAGFEEERFGRPSPFTMKFASSAAHIKNKQLVSSETATWLGDHFQVALSQVKPQIDELFTAGINHIFFHGITYNPPEKPFPGRLFYASTNFGTRSHFWEELPALNKYIERCQTVLQNTKPFNDVLVYFPIHDLWAKKAGDELIVRLDVHHSKKWLEETRFGGVISDLWKEGFTFDYISDQMLGKANVQDKAINLGENTYRAIVIPKCTYMPQKTLGVLNKLAMSGANIIFQEDLPESVPGFYNVTERMTSFNSLKNTLRPQVKVAAEISTELLKSGIDNEELAPQGLSFIRKKAQDGTVYFISNLANRFHKEKVSLANEYTQIELLDPLTGKSGIVNSRIMDEKTVLELHLEPGQSCILKCTNQPSSAPNWVNYTTHSNPVTIDSEWTISRLNDKENQRQKITGKKMVSWPEIDESWSLFSGKATYSCEFDLEEKHIGREMLMDLGDVRETARITLNGKEIALLWCLPYKTIIPEKLLKKRNKIEIEVTNLSFNKVIDLDRKGVPWKNFHEINFVNIKYEPFDASDKNPVPSGLLSSIKLFPISKNSEN